VNNSTVQTLLGVAVLAAVGLLYVAPSLLAAHRKATDLPRLLQLNVYLGWTVVVWAYCLVVAARRSPSPTPASGPPPPPRVRLQHDRMPGWVRDLPARERTWAALPRDTAPIPLDDDTEDR
jgi:hypothetical protein